jgi:hypothetical protein
VALAPIGTIYVPGWMGIAWSQPGGPGTQVFPAENTGPFTAYPVGGQLFAENSGLWFFGCQHSVMLPMIFRDYDSVTLMSAAMICCPICTYLQRVQEPYESIDDPMRYPIVIP